MKEEHQLVVDSVLAWNKVDLLIGELIRALDDTTTIELAHKVREARDEAKRIDEFRKQKIDEFRKQKMCKHHKVVLVSIGSMSFSYGDIVDTIIDQVQCLECGKILDDKENENEQ